MSIFSVLSFNCLIRELIAWNGRSLSWTEARNPSTSPWASTTTSTSRHWRTWWSPALSQEHQLSTETPMLREPRPGIPKIDIHLPPSLPDVLNRLVWGNFTVLTCTQPWTLTVTVAFYNRWHNFTLYPDKPAPAYTGMTNNLRTNHDESSFLSVSAMTSSWPPPWTCCTEALRGLSPSQTPAKAPRLPSSRRDSRTPVCGPLTATRTWWARSCGCNAPTSPMLRVYQRLSTQ